MEPCLGFSEGKTLTLRALMEPVLGILTSEGAVRVSVPWQLRGALPSDPPYSHGHTACLGKSEGNDSQSPN